MNKIFSFLMILLLNFDIFGQKIQIDTILMASPFSFTIYDYDKNKAHKAINSAIDEVVRIENMLSEWKPHTPISTINKYAGKKPIHVDNELLSIFINAKKFNHLSGGIFDITYAGMEKIWKYDGSMKTVPSDTQIKKALEGVGDKYLQINQKEQTIYLAHPKTKISFGSIGKAYAAEKAMEKIKAFGIKNAMVNASGDIITIGNPKDKKYWSIGIYQPFKKKKYRIVNLKNKAIVTSGNYEKFALIGNKTYGHIINPKTGFPSSEIKSVTVKGDDIATANFLSTTLMLTNKKERKKLKQLFPKYKIWIQK